MGLTILIIILVIIGGIMYMMNDTTSQIINDNPVPINTNIPVSPSHTPVHPIPKTTPAQSKPPVVSKPVTPAISTSTNNQPATGVTALPTVRIDSISPPSASVGSTVYISGKGFLPQGSSQIEVVVRNIDNQGPSQSGIAWIGSPSSDTSLNFLIPSQYCSIGGTPGAACSQETALTRGNYTMQIILPSSNAQSNAVNFTVR